MTSGEIEGGIPITLTLNDSIGTSLAPVQHAAFVAYQDGDSTWQAMPIQAGRYTATITSDRYGLAIGYRGPPPASSAVVKVLYQSVLDRTETVTAGPTPALTPYSLIVSADGFDLVAFDGSLAFTFPGMPLILPARQLTGNLFAWKAEFGVEDGKNVQRISKLVRMSKVNIETTPAVVLDASLPFPDPIPHPVSLNHGSMTGTVSSSLRNALTFESQTLGTSRHQVFSLPSSLLREHDFYNVACTFDAAPGATTYSSTYEVGSPDHLDIEPGASFTAPALQLIATPYLRPVATFTPAPEGLPNVDYTVRVQTPSSSHEVSATQAWIANDQSATLAMPDFSGVPGWSADLQIPDRTRLFWSVTRLEYNLTQPAPGSALRHAPGLIIHRAIASGTIGAYCGNGVVEPAFEQCDPPNGGTCSADCQNVIVVSELR